ncbi:hypothetical protein KCU71_g4770, partial [Aureobasidium melanogenum]
MRRKRLNMNRFCHLSPIQRTITTGTRTKTVLKKKKKKKKKKLRQDQSMDSKTDTDEEAVEESEEDEREGQGAEENDKVILPQEGLDSALPGLIYDQIFEEFFRSLLMFSTVLEKEPARAHGRAVL